MHPYQRLTLLLASAAIALPALPRAETLPWLDDPFGGQEKIATYGKKLRPANCPDIPEKKTNFTLNDVVIIALCHNPDTKSAYLSLMSSADSYVSNFSAYLPEITATGSRTRSGSFSRHSKTSGLSGGTGVSAGITLYDFGQREFKIEAAEKTLIAAGLGYDNTLQGAIASAISGYYSLLTAQNAVDVAKESDTFARESYEAAELKHKLGLVPLTEALQAKVSYSQSQLAVERAQNALAISRAALAQQMGLGVDRMVAVSEIDDSNLMQDPFDSKIKDLIARAKEKRVDLAASRASLEGAKTSLKATKRSNWATIGASASSDFDDAKVFNRGTTRSQSIGVSVSIPIFTGFSQTYSTRIAERDIVAQEESLRSAELGVEKDVWDAWHNYDNAKRSWEISWDELANATLLRDTVLGRYKEGLGTILEVLQAQSSYSAALNSHLQTRLSLLTSRVDLIRAVGELNLETMEPAPSTPASTPASPMID